MAGPGSPWGSLLVHLWVMKGKCPFQQELSNTEPTGESGEQKAGVLKGRWTPPGSLGEQETQVMPPWSGSGVGMRLPGGMPWAPWHHGLRSFCLSYKEGQESSYVAYVCVYVYIYIYIFF